MSFFKIKNCIFALLKNNILYYTMTTVKLKHEIKGGSVVFSVSEPTKQPEMYFSQPQIKAELKVLYNERYQLNSWRTVDKSVMEKEFGR